MSSETCFVRMRGRVTGPYTWADLQKLVRRGKLSRIHEISFDKVNWTPAGGFEELFPIESSQHEQAVRDPEAGLALADTPMEKAEVDGTSTEGAEILGARPIAFPPKERDATAPHDRPEEGNRSYHQDGEVGEARTGISSVNEYDLDTYLRADRITERASNLSLAGGLSAGVLMLFCLNVPHAKVDDRLIWWWDLLSRSDAALLALSCIYVLLASLSLFTVALLLRGQTRGWVYVGIGAAGFVLLIATAMSKERADFSVILPMTVPALGACLASVSFFRSLAPQAQSGKAVQTTLGGVLTLAALVAALMSGYYSSKLGSGSVPVPAGVIIALVISFMGHLCGLAGGILGVVGAKPSFSKPLNSATIVLSIVATMMPAISGLLLGYGLTNMLAEVSPVGHFLVVQIVRLLVVAYALIVLTAIGLSEVLIFGRFQLRADPNERESPCVEP